MKYKKLLFFMVLFLIPIVKINAASFSVSASSKSVTVGSNVTIYVKGSDVTGRVNISSSNASVLSSGNNSLWIEPNGSITFNAKKTGSATITVSSSSLSDGAGNDVDLGSKSITINVVEKQAPKQVSSNNSLKSLNISDLELEPAFDPGTTEYTVNAPEGTATINIQATPQDSNASINGIGEIAVFEGLNTLNIVVTAENGYQKEYKLNVNVKEEPIIVRINDKDVSLVKQANALPQVSSYYSPSTMEYKYEIDEEEKTIELPTYYSEVTGYTLVGIKDQKGNINLYIYEDGKYTLYNEVSFNNNIVIYEMDAKNIPQDYQKTNIDINDVNITAYQKDKNSDYYLIYGMNVDNGNIGWYKYDKKESSIQRYDSALINNLTIENKKYKTTIYLLSGICGFMLLSIMVLLIKIRNVKR